MTRFGGDNHFMRGWFERSMKPTFKWCEPPLFARRGVARYAARLRPLLIRAVVWGVVLGGITHWIVASNQLTIARPTWVLYLSGLPISLSMSFMLALMAVLPGTVYVGDQAVGTQNGSSIWRLNFDRLRAHRIVAIGANCELSALVLVYRDRFGRRRARSIGIGNRVDLVALDDHLYRTLGVFDPGVPPVGRHTRR